MICFVAHYMNR